ncbi:MAG: hypothetical protein RXR82_07335 [Nitrososphaeria archaeon]
MSGARIAANAAAALSMGFLYGYFDYHIQAATDYRFMGSPFPWVAMFLMFILPNALIHYRHVPVGLANAALGLSTEDLAYWFWARQLPASWAWFYPVWHHIPLDDVAGIVIAALLYWWGENYRSGWEARRNVGR